MIGGCTGGVVLHHSHLAAYRQRLTENQMSTESHNDETVSTAEDRKEAAGSSAEDHKNETVSGVEERKAETGSTVKDDNYDYNSVARDSFLNSLKHGAFSRRVLLPGESHEEFDAIYKSMKEELNPQGPVEEEKVQT